MVSPHQAGLLGYLSQWLCPHLWDCCALFPTHAAWAWVAGVLLPCGHMSCTGQALLGMQVPRASRFALVLVWEERPGRPGPLEREVGPRTCCWAAVGSGGLRVGVCQCRMFWGLQQTVVAGKVPQGPRGWRGF